MFLCLALPHFPAGKRQGSRSSYGWPVAPVEVKEDRAAKAGCRFAQAVIRSVELIVQPGAHDVDVELSAANDVLLQRPTDRMSAFGGKADMMRT